MDLVPVTADRPTAVLPLFPERVRAPAVYAEIAAERQPWPRAPHADLVMLADPDGPAAAQFRALRHRLVERGNPRTLLVTSATAGDGRTFTAANLALSLAELRRHRVLLLDASLRRPAVGRRFGLEPGAYSCFLAQLRAHEREPEAPSHVTAVGDTGLHLLAIGEPSDRAQMLAAPVFAAAVARLRVGFDYVVVDGPPALDGPDVTLVEDAVDGLVLVARAGRTRGRALGAALEQISPANVLGVVLVGA
jgi:Mrp family chromosome partitioning ATPase